MKRFTGFLTKRTPSHDQDGGQSSKSPEVSAADGVKLFCESANANGNPATNGDDVLQLPLIVEAAEASPQAAASAAHQIRKVLAKDTYASPAKQYNAIMLVRILSDNPGTTFTKAMDTKFVDAVRHVLRMSRDPSVQQIMRETLNSLERDKTNDENLKPLIKMWKKEKESGPGLPGPANPIRGAYGNLGVYRQPGAPSQAAYGNGRSNKSLPDPAELASRIEEARTTAKLLVQLTLSTPVEEFQGNDLLKEFSDRSQSAQRSLQGYMNSADPPPDEATFQTLIETCEMLSVASSKHQRALLAARRQTGSVSQGTAALPDETRGRSPTRPNQPSQTSPPTQAPDRRQMPPPQSVTSQNGTTQSNPFGDENRALPATQRYYGQQTTQARSTAVPAPSNAAPAFELDGSTHIQPTPELDGDATQTTFVSRDVSHYTPQLNPPPATSSRPSTSGTSDDLYSEHTGTAARSSVPHDTYQPPSQTQHTPSSSAYAHYASGSNPQTPHTPSSAGNAAVYPPRDPALEASASTPRSPPGAHAAQGSWGEGISPDLQGLRINGAGDGPGESEMAARAKGRVRDDNPLTPQMPVSGSGWNY